MLGALVCVICVYVVPLYLAAGLTPSVNNNISSNQLYLSNRTMSTPVMVGLPEVVTACQPLTVGVLATVPVALDVPPVITLPVTKILSGSLPKSTTRASDVLDITVPVAATGVLSPELTTPVSVSPTVKPAPSPVPSATS